MSRSRFVKPLRMDFPSSSVSAASAGLASVEASVAMPPAATNPALIAALRLKNERRESGDAFSASGVAIGLVDSVSLSVLILRISCGGFRLDRVRRVHPGTAGIDRMPVRQRACIAITKQGSD